jgi:energy-converting hydrogenase Eha subunit E
MATAIGIIAGLCVITSMLLRSERWIKALLLAGAILFLAYGIMLRLLPIIMLNSVGTLVGIREMVRLSRLRV